MLQVATVFDYIQDSSGHRFPHKCYADIHTETYRNKSFLIHWNRISTFFFS